MLVDLMLVDLRLVELMLLELMLRELLVGLMLVDPMLVDLMLLGLLPVGRTVGDDAWTAPGSASIRAAAASSPLPGCAAAAACSIARTAEYPRSPGATCAANVPGSIPPNLRCGSRTAPPPPCERAATPGCASHRPTQRGGGGPRQ